MPLNAPLLSPSIESIYNALANTTAEITWLRMSLHTMNFAFTLPSTLIFGCDNVATTYLAANLVLHAGTKYVEIDFHFV